MACQLAPDSTGTVDFITSAGAQITVVIRSGSATAKITAVILNGTPLTLAGGRAVFTVAAGRNHLDLAFAGSDPAEDFEIHEDGGGSTKLMRKGNFLNGPTLGFRIHAF
jgi:hypothetical protein